MGSIIGVTNEKGGVGKTTTGANLAAAYASMGKSVLTVDMDPQANLTNLMGVSQEVAREHSIGVAIMEKMKLDSFIVSTKNEGIDIVPASGPELRRAMTRLGMSLEQGRLLHPVFNTTKLNEYEIVIIDTHGSQDCLLTSTLSIANYYLIPLFAEADAAQGVFEVIEFANRVREATGNLSLRLLGLVITGYNENIAVHRRIKSALFEFCEKEWNVNIFSNVIPFSARVKTAAEEKRLLTSFQGEEITVRDAYQRLAGEILPLLKGKRRGQVSKPKLEEIKLAIENIDNWIQPMDEIIRE